MGIAGLAGLLATRTVDGDGAYRTGQVIGAAMVPLFFSWVAFRVFDRNRGVAILVAIGMLVLQFRDSDGTLRVRQARREAMQAIEKGEADFEKLHREFEAIHREAQAAPDVTPTADAIDRRLDWLQRLRRASATQTGELSTCGDLAERLTKARIPQQQIDQELESFRVAVHQRQQLDMLRVLDAGLVDQGALLALQRQHLGHWHFDVEGRLVFDDSVSRADASRAAEIEQRLDANADRMLQLQAALKAAMQKDR